MEPQFRLANAADIEILMEFMRQFYAIDQYPLDESVARTALEKIVDDRSLGRVWLIYIGGEGQDEAIGYIVVTFGYSLEYHGRDAFIDEFFIVTSQRNQGVGKKSMQFVLGACRNLGIQALHLEVERSNTAGQSLYRRYDFEDQDRFLMTRWITP